MWSQDKLAWRSHPLFRSFQDPTPTPWESTLSLHTAHTHTQTDTHTDRQTHRHTHTQTHIDTHTQTHTDPHTQTHTHRHTHRHTDRHTDRHTHTQTHTHRHTHTQTHTHRDTHRDTHTHTHTHSAGGRALRAPTCSAYNRCSVPADLLRIPCRADATRRVRSVPSSELWAGARQS